jgi:outer membrane protein assembly factor BamC
MKTTSFTLALAMFFVLAVVSGCGGKKGSKIDYEAARSLPPLEVPPDLSSLPPDTHTSTTGGSPGAATYSQFEKEQQRKQGPKYAGLLPEYQNVRLVRAGTERWLVVNETPDKLWPQLLDFIDKMGLSVSKQEPAAGIMETNWAENRAGAGGRVERIFPKITGQGAGTGLRDRYRIRLERGEQPGTTEIYLTHRGVQSVVVHDTGPVDLTGRELEGRSAWIPRPNDPELEAQMLRLLMVHLGTKPSRAKAIIASPQPVPDRAKLIRTANGYPYLTVADTRERAWRRVGLSLDRIGFTVEDRDRSKWTYYVRYIDPGEEGKKKKKKKVEQKTEYQIALESIDDGTKVVVLDNDGKPEASKTSEQILSLLYEQLK